MASASCAFSSHMAAYCNRTCGVHGHYVDQIKIVIENYLFSQPLCLSFIPQATASSRVQLREKVKLFRASPKLRGTPFQYSSQNCDGCPQSDVKRKGCSMTVHRSDRTSVMPELLRLSLSPCGIFPFCFTFTVFFLKTSDIGFKKECDQKLLLFSSCKY